MQLCFEDYPRRGLLSNEVADVNVWRIWIFASAKIAHLSDDETVAKMGHPNWPEQVRCQPGFVS